MELKNNISKYKGFLFDLDGTLVDSLGVWYDADIKTLENFGVTNHKNYSESKDHFFHNNPKAENIYEVFYKYCIDLYKIKNVTVAEYKKFREDTAYGILKNIDYRQDAAKLLKLLKSRGHKLALVTVGTNRFLDLYSNENENIKKSADIKAIFGDNIITSEMVKNKKPDPEAYLRSIEKLGLDPTECLAFEDSYEGTMSSTRAKLDTCVIHERHSDKNRDKINALTPFQIKNFGEIIDMFK